MRRVQRSKRGAILAISIGCTILLSFLGTFLFYLCQTFIVNNERAQHAAQSAVIKAACELSNIVIADPHWGFVSLSDHPACGTGTTAPDNEPLPVTGYNTIVSTVRTEKLIAESLSNQTLRDLAEDDYKHYTNLKISFQNMLENSLSADCKLNLKDMNGKPVKVYETALQAFLQNLPEVKSGKMKLKSFSLSLGWLEDGSITTTVNPELSEKNSTKYYQSFIDVPITVSTNNNHFYFAGVANQVKLVETSRFRPADNKHFSSCVKIQAELEPEDASCGSLLVTATALPYNESNYSASGSLAVLLPQGTGGRVSCLNDLLSNQILNQTLVTHSIAQGDFPVDTNASLIQTAPSNVSISRSVGRAILDWLRTCQSKNIRTTSIISALNSPFINTSTVCKNDLVVIYSTDEAGNIRINTLGNSGFQRKIVADRQSYDTATALFATEKLSIDVRNHVADTGVLPVSKHGGQPLYSELPSAFSSFTSEEERIKTLEHQNKALRISYYRGGLAAAIELNLLDASN